MIRFVTVLSCLTLLVPLAGCTSEQPPESGAVGPESHAAVAVTGQNFEEVVLQSDKPVLVDFWAEWCGPCKTIAPYVEQVAADYHGRAVVAKLDLDDSKSNPATAEVVERYNVASIPTMIVFKEGVEVDRMIGYDPDQPLKEQVEQLLQSAL